MSQLSLSHMTRKRIDPSPISLSPDMKLIHLNLTYFLAILFRALPGLTSFPCNYNYQFIFRLNSVFTNKDILVS